MPDGEMMHGAGVANAAPALLLERIALVALTLAAWSLVPFGTFQYDDLPNIVLEPSTLELTRASGLRALTRLSYFLDHALWGMHARGFLLTNLLLHVGSVLCVHALASARLPADDRAARGRAAFLAAALFALQPAHAEVVAYASGRATGLMTLLLLAGLALRDQGRKRASLAAFALACLAKETALIFPLLVWLRERDRRELAKLAAAALAVLALLAAVPRYRELLAWSLAERPPLASLAVSLAVLPEQLSLWVRPWALSVEHAVDLTPSAAAVLAGGALLAALLGAAVAARRRAPQLGLAIGWVLVALLPSSSLIARADPLSERALYLAWVGPAIALGCALARARPLAPRLVPAATALLLVAMAGFAFARVRTWSDARLLWADAAKNAPASARAWNNLGMAHFGSGDYGLARAAFERALALDPSSARTRENLRQVRLACGAPCP